MDLPDCTHALFNDRPYKRDGKSYCYECVSVYIEDLIGISLPFCDHCQEWIDEPIVYGYSLCQYCYGSVPAAETRATLFGGTWSYDAAHPRLHP